MAIFTLSATEKTTLLELFRLTAAETRVATLLMDGKSTKEMMQSLGICANTLKNHLAHIFEKTGTSGRTELVRLLILGPLPQEP